MIYHPRHHAEGDGSTCPPLVPGSIRCYNMKYCPYAERSLLALSYKNVKFDIVNVHLKEKPSWFLARSALGKVPTFERDDGETITESLVTMEYLDEMHPEPALFPGDPWKKAQDKVLVQIFESKVIPLFFKSVFNYPDDIQDFVEAFAKELNYFETELTRRNTQFFSGKQPGFVDLAIFPWFERLPLLQHICPSKPLTENHPKLTKWMSDIEGVPGLQPIIISGEEHILYMETVWKGERNYDIAFKE